MEQKKYLIDDNGNCTIPEGVKEIENSAFEGCTSLISINIPYSVEKIGSRAFKDCTSIKSIHIPGSVITIGIEAFCRCTSLESVKISEGVREVGGGAFIDCKSLKSVVFPFGLMKIGLAAFSNCTSLKKVIIPCGYIDGSFCGCTSLEEVFIDSSQMNSASFDFCPSLKSVYLHTYIPKGADWTGTFDRNAKENGTLYVPADCIQTCKKDKELGQFKNIEIEDPKKIEEILEEYRESMRGSSSSKDEKLNLDDFDLFFD